MLSYLNISYCAFAVLYLQHQYTSNGDDIHRSYIFNVCRVFWTVYITFAYDIAEIYEYKYEQRCDGSIVAIVDLSYKLGAAKLLSFLSGALLTAIGYVEGGANQSQQVLDGINMICTLPAAITFVIAGTIVFMYPVTRKKYDLLGSGDKGKKRRIALR